MEQIHITKAFLPDGAPKKGFLKVGQHIVDCGALRVVTRVPMQSLPPKSIHVLYELARNAGDTVSREALMTNVWPEKKTDACDVVKQAIMGLRRALDSQQHTRSMIETIPKTGYRLNTSCRYAENFDDLNRAAKNKSRNHKTRPPAGPPAYAENVLSGKHGFHSTQVMSIKIAASLSLLVMAFSIILMIAR
ncbi:MAG: helix-turn-helix domain-containing protein [Arenimonas sp.]